MRVLLACLLVLVVGCPFVAWPPGGDIVCTEIFVYGVNVTVTDANGDPITGATLTLTEGTYVETMQELQAGSYAGAGERAGTYTLTVEAAGFVTQTLDNIVVDEDECHVIPVSREVTLVAG